MERKWVVRDVPNEQLLPDFAGELNINQHLASLLLQRGISTFEDARHFFRPSLSRLHDPFLMKDMGAAVNRLSEALAEGQHILVYGDYDVDGTTSVAMVYSFLKNYADKVSYYIPDRYKEGYGISTQGITHASEQDVQLIIALDCGIRAIDKVQMANGLGIDMIICDHHLPGSELPDALAILDPKQPEDQYPYKELSGCGVGFKLLQGFCLQNSIDLHILYEYLDLVAVSIASDIVPITGENRILAFYGLRKINQAPRPGLKALIDISGLKGELNISAVVFYLGPRINAAGRLAHATDSVKLLIAETDEETAAFADQLNTRNTERKDFDKTITEEALEMVESDEILKAAKSTVLFKNDWHKGVVGIVASRCIEKYYRPTIILTESGNKATGSARSVEGFDIHEAIGHCSELLEQYGGHRYAAGLTLSVDKVPEFQKKFEEVVSQRITREQLEPKLRIDLEVPLSFINHKAYQVIKQMAPFGPRNLSPVFVTRNIILRHPAKVLKESHVKFMICREGDNFTYDCIGFGLAEKATNLAVNQPFDIVYQIEENNYRGNKTLQLNIRDIRID